MQSCIVASVQEAIDEGRVVEETGPNASRNRLQTEPLLAAIERHRFDAVFGGARRDEEKARAKGADVLVPRRVRAVGSQEPAAGVVEHVQRTAPQRRAHARVPDLQLDRDGHLAVRADGRDRAAFHLLLPPPAVCSSATAC